jgi:hypothetical protein
MDTCNAVQINGNVCGSRVVAGATMCARHSAARERHGPNKYELMQLRYSYNKQRADRNALRMRDINDNIINIDLIDRTYHNDIELLYLTYSIAKREILNRHQRDFQNRGIDPDAAALDRRNQERIRRREVQVERVRGILAGRLDRLRVARREVVNILDGQDDRVGNVVEVQQVGELEAFIQDKQNVHTSAAVKQTKDIVALLRTIPVPIEYQWHSINTSLTPFEIGMECKLSQRAAWQMISQYAQDTAIYDIETGIYGKVLDSVWQYIKNSKEKSELCRVLKQEMEDNIGMCAQGNLSRVCNILAGYLEGVGSQESKNERLGRLFSSLNTIDIIETCKKGFQILIDNEVTEDEWYVWMEPFFSEADVNAKYEILKQSPVVCGKWSQWISSE